MHVLRLPKKTPPGAIVGRWLKSQGQVLTAGDCLLEIETPQARVEIETDVAGRLLKILAAEGTPAQVGTALAVIGEPGEDSDHQAHYVEADTQQKENEGMAEPTAQAAGNVVPILMPQAGQSMEEGTVLSWQVKPGDTIEVGQVIMEIETDKATMDVEAVDAGKLARIVVQEGETVDVKVPVAYLAEQDSDVDAYLTSQANPTEVQTKAPSTVQQEPSGSQAPQTESAKTDTGRIKASPAARKLAGERGIDLAAIPSGSGPGGRIVSDDVKSSQPQEQSGQLSRMRRAIAHNLLYSKQNIPHFYGRQTIRADAMFDLYKQTKERFKCSVNDLVVAACARGVRQWPVFRSRFEDDRIVELPDVNIGIAVGTDDGLVVPVLVGADEMDFETLATRSREIIEAARTGKIIGLGKGVFTVTNLGMFGLDEFTAIINPPESAILAVGAIRDDVTAVDGKIQPAKLMTFNLSVDHRVIDGVMAAKFLQTIKELLEDPQQLV